MSSMRTRLAAGVAAAAVAVSLSACSQTLMHDGATAGSLGGTSVSTTQVQDAVDQIGKVAPGFDGESATAFILLLPKLEQIGHKFGVTVSAADAKAALPHTPDPTNATVEAARGSLLFTKLQNLPQGQQAIKKLLETADVQLNPRYGQWVKGKGPTKNLAPWIKQVATSGTAG